VQSYTNRSGSPSGCAPVRYVHSSVIAAVNAMPRSPAWINLT
jgi:hypothetical protein